MRAVEVGKGATLPFTQTKPIVAEGTMQPPLIVNHLRVARMSITLAFKSAKVILFLMTIKQKR
jgi:hypothetical protein